MPNAHSDIGIETLLDLHGYTVEVGEGLWISMKAWRVPPDDKRPNGISYTITMHRPGGSRILGYDNAHWPKLGSGPAMKAQRRGRGCDHRHFRNQVAWYNFESPAKLIDDFWSDVATLMREEGVPWQ